MIEIPLTSAGAPAIVDNNFGWLAQWQWGRKQAGHTDYARAGQIFMHRIIIKAPKGFDVDHINHDGLDNRCANLRVVSRSENLRNRRPEAIGRNIRHCSNGRWRAQISYENRTIYLGTYDDQEMAELAVRYVTAHICQHVEIPSFAELRLPHQAWAFLEKFGQHLKV